ncbi:interferon alpha/beta receptor 1a-like [Sinocyclocheilus grahami]|uniref:interferon alpha/beta receptor 1a-like n=1 Tax=Sinocyclocheilus grahami TaxID=75366 RepID=UPI0007AC8D64|nr:PREDICTED: interferon alpha/beta receptor 1a-like [Sinocyclocheilus grahami]
MKALRCFCFSVCALLLLEESSGFRDLRRPENVSVDSLNTRYVLRWDWPHETAANQTVTFTAQYLEEFRSRKASNEKYWTSVCVSVLEHRCDFTGAELHYNDLYLLRVWANTSQQSSGWVQIRFCPDKHAALGPPSSLKLSSIKGDLEIIITDPLSSTNQSMKTLLNDRLSYLIQYWRRSAEPQVSVHTRAKSSRMGFSSGCLWLSDSEKPQLLAPESPESVCELLVMVSAELDAVAVDEHSNTEEQDSSTHGRHGSGDSGVYSTEEDTGHRSDLQMSSRKHREELHDGMLLELCA